MKKTFILVLTLFVTLAYSQDNNVKIEQKGDLTQATYFHDNGVVAQQGTFNADGQLHGLWISYDENGDKITVGSYEKGKKVGKWLFYSDMVIKEVDYIDSRIASVKEVPLVTDM